MQGHPEVIRSGKQIRHLRFVGESMAKRVRPAGYGEAHRQIDEILTGAKGRLFFEDTEQARAVAKFQNVYGVGSRCAHELYTRGARSIEDLRTKDFGLTAGQKAGSALPAPWLTGRLVLTYTTISALESLGRSVASCSRRSVPRRCPSMTRSSSRSWVRTAAEKQTRATLTFSSHATRLTARRTRG